MQRGSASAHAPTALSARGAALASRGVDGNRDREGPPRLAGALPVAQLPNAPLLAAFAGWAVAAASHGTVHDYGRAAFYAFLAAWGWGELTGGVNAFRRALGAAGLAYVVVRLATA